MKYSLFIFYIISNSLFLLASFLSLPSMKMLLDFNAIVIVFGGTLCTVFFSNPYQEIKKTVLKVFSIFFKKESIDKIRIIQDIVDLSRAKKKGDAIFDQEIKKVSDPFLKDAAKLLFWTANEVSLEDFHELLNTRAVSYYLNETLAPKLLKNISKYPPAFGMLGTVIGLIAMLTSLSDPNAKTTIGPAMAVAMITTLYGVFLNNMIFLPISDHLTSLADDKIKIYDLIIEGIMLIQAKKPTQYVQEKLLSFISPDEHEEIRKKFL